MVKIHSRRWTPEEDAIFRKMAEANTRPEIIAAKLKRSVHAIKARAYIIGLRLKSFKVRAKEAPDAPRFVSVAVMFPRTRRFQM